MERDLYNHIHLVVYRTQRRSIAGWLNRGTRHDWCHDITAYLDCNTTFLCISRNDIWSERMASHVSCLAHMLPNSLHDLFRDLLEQIKSPSPTSCGKQDYQWKNIYYLTMNDKALQQKLVQWRPQEGDHVATTAAMCSAGCSTDRKHAWSPRSWW